MTLIQNIAIVSTIIFIVIFISDLSNPVPFLSGFNQPSKFVMLVGIILICILLYQGDMPDKCEVGETNGDKETEEK